MPKFLFRIGADENGPCLYPDHDKGRAWIKRQPHEFVEMECKGVRSPEQLRAYWGRLNRVYANLPEAWQSQFSNTKMFHARTKCALGYCDRHESRGKVIEVPHSIGIGNMDHDDFNDFFTKATDLWATTLGVTPDDLRAQDYMDAEEIGI